MYKYNALFEEFSVGNIVKVKKGFEFNGEFGRVMAKDSSARKLRVYLSDLETSVWCDAEALEMLK